ncbi:hypothetical protein [Kushneria konosiri]|uniref:Uncharacterized protein n=1 Tax=Kushneria konosiri TaxID=698828 RepID=A0A2Z2H841_9GAMM|nr:hypothetical protein [Kushneria konosiri]ARS53518.1 hypothetical protein B9G99_12170 [Kushneria konosiri]
MTDSQGVTHTFNDDGLPSLRRSYAVEQHVIKSELQTLLIIAGYACDFFDEGLKLFPEDFFTCIEEMKEVMESIDLKSLELEKQSLVLQRIERRRQVKPSHQNI